MFDTNFKSIKLSLTWFGDSYVCSDVLNFITQKFLDPLFSSLFTTHPAWGPVTVTVTDGRWMTWWHKANIAQNWYYYIQLFWNLNSFKYNTVTTLLAFSVFSKNAAAFTFHSQYNNVRNLCPGSNTICHRRPP